MKRFIVCFILSLIGLSMLMQPTVMAIEEDFDTIAVYTPFYHMFIDSANNETTYVKAGEVQSPYFKSVFNISSQLGTYVHGIKVEHTRTADIQPVTSCWFGGQFVLNAGTSAWDDIDKPAYAIQGIIKGDQWDGVQDVNAGRFELQSSGSVRDIVYILANSGTSVSSSMLYMPTHVSLPNMIQLNAQSTSTITNAIDILSGAGSSYNYGIDLSDATINTADFKLGNGALIYNKHPDSLIVTEANVKIVGNFLATTYLNLPVPDSAVIADYAYDSDKLDNVSLESITWSDVAMATGDVNMDDITPANASLNMNTDYHIKNVRYVSVTIQDTLLIEFGYNSGYVDFIPLLPKKGAGLLINNEFGYDFANNKWILDGAFEFEDDGAGCGFDADLLDGYSEDYFLDTNDVVGGLTGHDSTNFLYSDTIDIGEFISVLGTKVFEIDVTLNNVAIGNQALLQVTTGHHIFALGYRALYTNQSGNYNIALGASALQYSTASNNTAIGYQALYTNTSGTQNLAIGKTAMSLADEGSYNIAIGNAAGTYIGKGGSSSNIAIGVSALSVDSTGSYNIGIGREAGRFLTTGVYNTFIGYRAGGYGAGAGATDPDHNVAIGSFAGYKATGDFNVMIGRSAGYNAVGFRNVFLGYQAGYNETGNDRGYIANSSTDSTIYIEFDNDFVRIKDSLEVSSIVTDKIYAGGGEQLVKFAKIGSHLAIVLNASADTFWIAADTTGF